MIEGSTSMLPSALHFSVYRRSAGSPLSIPESTTEAPPLGTGHAAPHTLGLVGGEGVGQALVLDRTTGAHFLCDLDLGIFFCDGEEELGARPGASGIIAPALVWLPKQITEGHHHFKSLTISAGTI